MTQETQLYWELLQELDLSGKVVRATIVRTWGSTPRETGAKMLVTPSGAIRGTVGGGCGEAEVWQEARSVLGSGDPRLVHVDLTEDTESDSGKVCGGRFDVFLDRWQQGQGFAASLRTALESPEEKVLVTYLGPEVSPSWKKTALPPAQPLATPPPGSHFVIDCGSRSPAPWPEDLVEAARQASRQGRSQACVANYPEGPQAFFLDCLGVPADLVVAGAGHIARPLCEMASLCGFRVTIVDDRREYAQESFFARAHAVLCQDFGQAFRDYPWSRRSHVVLVTRGHKHDEDCLRQLIGHDLAYLGMIGSRRRTRAVLSELEAEGVSPQWLSQIYSPIGIDIGAETPEEIAVSILAELIKVRRGGTAASLKLRS